MLLEGLLVAVGLGHPSVYEEPLPKFLTAYPEPLVLHIHSLVVVPQPSLHLVVPVNVFAGLVGNHLRHLRGFRDLGIDVQEHTDERVSQLGVFQYALLQRRILHSHIRILHHLVLVLEIKRERDTSQTASQGVRIQLGHLRDGIGLDEDSTLKREGYGVLVELPSSDRIATRHLFESCDLDLVFVVGLRRHHYSLAFRHSDRRVRGVLAVAGFGENRCGNGVIVSFLSPERHHHQQSQKTLAVSASPSPDIELLVDPQTA